MSQINDCKHEALVAALGHDGHINDLLLEYYQLNGAISENINDAAIEFLIAQGAAPAHVNDMWHQVLSALGYEGALNDMLHQFWCEDGGDLTAFNHEFTIGENATGDRHGYDSSGFVGELDPDVTKDTVILRFCTTSETGNSVGLWLEDGVRNADYYILRIEHINLEMTWQESNDLFIVSNAELAAFLRDNVGNTYTIKLIPIGPAPVLVIDLHALAVCMANQGWTIAGETATQFTIIETGAVVTLTAMQACDFSGFIGPVAADLQNCVQAQGFCI